MSAITMAIGATLLALVVIIIWLISMVLRRQRLETERKKQAAAYRNAMLKAKEQEKKERQFKAESGHVPTMLFLAKEAERSNVKKALYWYEQAALKDNEMGMYGFIRLSQKFNDDLVIKEKANFWRYAVAGLHQGDSDALFKAGKAYIEGKGIETNATKGMSFIHRAAEKGALSAMLYLADEYKEQEGEGESALFWYQKACQLNSPQAMVGLGHCYIKGIGTEESKIKGAYWFERAAEQGYPEAMYHAGMAWYGSGQVGNALAYVWLYLACHFGYEKARAPRDKVATTIGVDTVVGLQAIANPLIQKINSGHVGKHTIIKALNKVYSRPSYFPSEVASQHDESERSEASINTQSNESDTREEAIEGKVESQAIGGSQETGEEVGAANRGDDTLDFSKPFN